MTHKKCRLCDYNHDFIKNYVILLVFLRHWHYN